MENARRVRGTEPTSDCLSRLSRASLRINESLDVGTALRAELAAQAGRGAPHDRLLR